MNTWNCSSGLTISIGIGRGLEALGVGRHHEQHRLELAGPRVLGARDDEHVVGLVDAGDVDLAAVEHPARRRRGGAVVVMLWVLVPASGSVIANAIVPVPSQMPGSQRCFCSSVP